MSYKNFLNLENIGNCNCEILLMLCILYAYSDNVPRSFVSIFQRPSNEGKETVRRLPSAPTTTSIAVSAQPTAPVPIQEIFRRAGNWYQKGDVAGHSGAFRFFSHRLDLYFVID